MKISKPKGSPKAPKSKNTANPIQAAAKQLAAQIRTILAIQTAFNDDPDPDAEPPGDAVCGDASISCNPIHLCDCADCGTPRKQLRFLVVGPEGWVLSACPACGSEAEIAGFDVNDAVKTLRFFGGDHDDGFECGQAARMGIQRFAEDLAAELS